MLWAGFDQTAIAEGRFPHRSELDAVQPDRPVRLLHVSGHAGAVNSAAMERLGLAGSGFLEGMEAMGALGATDFGISEEGFAAGLAVAAGEYLAQGVTLAQNAWIEQRMLDCFVALDRAGGMGIDALLLPKAALEPGLSATPPSGLKRLILGPRKLFADGAFQVQTAHLTRPYHKPIDGDPDPLAAPDVVRGRTAHRGRQHLGRGQRITPEEALRAHTLDAAWQVFHEYSRGSIEAGKRADFAILSDDPLTTAKPLKDIAVQETVVLGETAWRRD